MKANFVILSSLILLSFRLSAQVVFVVDSFPARTRPDDTIFMASELNGWNPHDISWAFKRTTNRYELKLTHVKDTFEYKLSRGSWQLVEVDSNGGDIRNRIYFPPTDTVSIKVNGWRDMFEAAQRKSTASTNVRFLPSTLEMKQLNRRRAVRLYLPPNYSKRQQFPVIYMHDGQNVFDEATSFAGEWRVDEIMDSLYYSCGFAAIVVAIYNDSKERINEYSPWRNDSLGMGGDGDKYAYFVAKELKPFIDKNYRTNPEPKFNAVIGSSMGGLISLYIGLKYPDAFGRVGVFSPSLWFSPKVFEYVSKYKRRADQKIYLLAGEKESETLVEDMKMLEHHLYKAGYKDEDYVKMKIAPDGRHSEWFWSREFTEALEYLFEIRKN
ncbi:MAG: alpha/beta hydrolase-fold protein [Tenuifilum sp.]|uniref:alpha/beta hydrolase n=1 Tax=Tenuifilum sp. TaxID=2760880 RepID=UPI001B5E612B|nr:alpha/beta hydrolase [Bacteroidales bacterium]HOK60959.1 alpha/beta hydrolase-fold protein [Tenuifilum sp.]MBP9028513.1 alpha/beta hydrolase [Bacteroidales bacterium]HOK85360.1 alpha/beta hydrolase-fold protein [Tenuifilum sp.]HON70168.1 alpha/beta hydrolase-fold protein [Tenuifilum sp.]